MTKFIVCDLDGTLIDVNTFPLWVKFLLKKSFYSHKPCLLVGILTLLFKRKIFRLSHEDFKSMLQRLEYDESWDCEFAHIISAWINPLILQDIIKHKKAGDRVVLATAAPINYAEPFARLVLNDDFPLLASGWFGDRYVNNSGEQKALCCYNYFGRYPDVFFTDHYEDLPLILKASLVYLVNPTEKSVRIISEITDSWQLYC